MQADPKNPVPDGVDYFVSANGTRPLYTEFNNLLKVNRKVGHSPINTKKYQNKKKSPCSDGGCTYLIGINIARYAGTVKLCKWV